MLCIVLILTLPQLGQVRGAAPPVGWRCAWHQVASDAAEACEGFRSEYLCCDCWQALSLTFFLGREGCLSLGCGEQKTDRQSPSCSTFGMSCMHMSRPSCYASPIVCVDTICGDCNRACKTARLMGRIMPGLRDALCYLFGRLSCSAW